ncbi:ribosomal RNA small subunit methyltransferase A [candidate division WOR-3 bacterium]|nr:ribosomal RNA small subunit methyltransferase A [candidate division WOR-3 bacterium]
MEITEILEAIGARPKKSLGQNFLMDKNIARKICDAVPGGEDLRIVEIGPGTGVLTEILAEKTDDLILVEKDAALASYLKKHFKDKASVIADDFLKLDPDLFLKSENRGKACAKTGGNFLVGNLPYNISKRILRKTFSIRSRLTGCVFTFQKEVAEKLTALPSYPNYGILSVLFGFCSKTKIVAKISPECFFPKPEVYSASVSILFNENQTEAEFSDDDFEKLVRNSFRQRRKVLLNNLRGVYRREDIEKIREFCRKRPQELSPADFAEMMSRIMEK